VILPVQNGAFVQFITIYLSHPSTENSIDTDPAAGKDSSYGNKGVRGNGLSHLAYKE
jgi:hypothetical protein